LQDAVPPTHEVCEASAMHVFCVGLLVGFITCWGYQHWCLYTVERWQHIGRRDSTSTYVGAAVCCCRFLRLVFGS
jgi:hypothetical protein